MDTVIDENANKHALKEQTKMALTYRNIGIGIMGLADMFVMLGIAYGDDRSKSLTGSLIREIFRSAIYASVQLGKTKGNFPGYNSNFWKADIFKSNFEAREIEELANNGYMRNCSLLSVAPCGSIGTMLGISTGVEPFFALSYNRKTVSLNGGDDKIYKVDIQALKDYKIVTGREEIPDYFVTAKDIYWKDRVDIQSILQESVDTAISSTLNIREDASIDTVKNIYKYAWERGLKGITIYREGSREPILSTNEIVRTNYHKRPKVLNAEYFPVKIKGEQFAVIIGYQEDKPYEIFAIRPSVEICQHKGIVIKKSKGVYAFESDIAKFNNILDTNINIEERSATLYISMLLRHNVPLKYIIKTARKANPSILSFTSAICRILSKFLDNEVVTERCPICGGKLIKEGGCIHCENNDYSKCGD